MLLILDIASVKRFTCSNLDVFQNTYTEDLEEVFDENNRRWVCHRATQFKTLVFRGSDEILCYAAFEFIGGKYGLLMENEENILNYLLAPKT